MKVSTSYTTRQSSPNMPSQHSKPKILDRSLPISTWRRRIRTRASLTRPTRIKSTSNGWCRKSRPKVLKGLITLSHLGLISTTMSVRLLSNKSRSLLKSSILKRKWVIRCQLKHQNGQVQVLWQPALRQTAHKRLSPRRQWSACSRTSTRNQSLCRLSDCQLLLLEAVELPSVVITDSKLTITCW